MKAVLIMAKMNILDSASIFEMIFEGTGKVSFEIRPFLSSDFFKSRLFFFFFYPVTIFFSPAFPCNNTVPRTFINFVIVVANKRASPTRPPPNKIQISMTFTVFLFSFIYFCKDFTALHAC